MYPWYMYMLPVAQRPALSYNPLVVLPPLSSFLTTPSSSHLFPFVSHLHFFCLSCPLSHSPPLLSFLLPLPEKALTPFSEIALTSLLQLLKKEVSEHSRHLQQYFQAFLNYANKGPFEVCHHTSLFLLFVSCVLYIYSELLNGCICLTCESTRSVSIALVNN